MLRLKSASTSGLREQGSLSTVQSQTSNRLSLGYGPFRKGPFLFSCRSQEHHVTSPGHDYRIVIMPDILGTLLCVRYTTKQFTFET